MERDGTTINRSAMKQCVDVLLALRDTTIKVTAESIVYKMYLEDEILKESEAYYKYRAKEMLEAHDLSEYIRLVSHSVSKCLFILNKTQVEVYINSEQDRTHSYLSFHTSASLQHILVSNLLTPYTSTLLSGSDTPAISSSSGDTKFTTALDTLIDAERTDDLARVLRMFLLPPEESGMKILRKHLKDSIITRGRVINDESDEGVTAPAQQVDSKKPAEAASTKSTVVQTAIKWMTDVLNLKDLCDRLLRNAWGGEVSLQVAINEACSCLVIHWNALTRAGLGFRIVRESEQTSVRIYILIHRRPPKEGHERGKS